MNMGLYRRRGRIKFALHGYNLSLHLYDPGFKARRAQTIGNGVIETIEPRHQLLQLTLLIGDALGCLTSAHQHSFRVPLRHRR